MNGQVYGQVFEPQVEPKKKSEGGLWKILTVVFGLIAAVLGFLLLTKKEPVTVVFVNEDNVRLEKVEKGSKVNKPNVEEEDFLGWFDGGSEFDFTKGVDKDVVLYAKYDTSKEFTVTFDTAGGSEIDPVKVKENKTVKQPTAPTKAGLIFNEWTLNGEVYDFNTPVTSDITLKATWRENDNTVMVRFDSAGGSSVNSQKVAIGGAAKKPNNPTKSCATFKEWQLDGAAYDFSKTVDKEITLKAVWTEKQKVTLSFDTAGGSAAASKQVCPGEAVGTLPTPTKSGYVLTGWTLNGSAFNANSKVNGNTTVKAEWMTQDEYNYNKAVAAIKASYTITQNGQTISVSSPGCTITHDPVTMSTTTITFHITCGSKTGTKTAKGVANIPTYKYTVQSSGNMINSYVTIVGVTVSSGNLCLKSDTSKCFSISGNKATVEDEYLKSNPEFIMTIGSDTQTRYTVKKG